jgi:cell division protein ZapE
MAADVKAQYAARVAAGEIERDAAQERVLDQLAQLERRLREHRLARKSSSLGWLFGARERREEPIRGLYVFGEVGRGKTMLMDLFCGASAVLRKRRAHFHEFMGDVHERVREFRQQIKLGQVGNGEDPIRLAAAAIAQETWLLCFDEFHVTDIADAMILGRLFTRLFELGVVVVATSNVEPDELYKDGLNRALFLPFIGLIEERMEVVRLSARADFRLEKLSGQPVWHVPADGKADAALDHAWRRLTGGHTGTEQKLTVKGRTLKVPHAAMGVARFSFHDLCEQPLAAADYLRIAHDFHTVVLDRIPVMDHDRRNEAKRFIILIDTLYDNAVKLVASAAAEPDALYLATEGYEAREFRRTASRLIEMRSEAYLALPHGHRDSQASGMAEGIVET